MTFVGLAGPSLGITLGRLAQQPPAVKKSETPLSFGVGGQVLFDRSSICPPNRAGVGNRS